MRARTGSGRVRVVTTLLAGALAAAATMPVAPAAALGTAIEAGEIETVAGGGNGDGGQATAALVAEPGDAAVDHATGDTYIVDRNRVRKVDVWGVITTIAGTGSSTFGGDGGPATAAGGRIDHVAVGPDGAVYVSGGHRVRKIAGGVISTIAGTGVEGYGGENGPAVQALLNHPTSLSVDADGDVFVVDSANHRVRHISASSGLISTVAGSGVAGFAAANGPARTTAMRPSAVAVRSDGMLYVAESANNVVRLVDGGGILRHIAGNGVGFSGDGGPATSAALDGPNEVGVDSADQLYIGDRRNFRIRRVTASGTISTIVGDGSAGWDGNPAPATATGIPLTYGFAVRWNGDLVLASSGFRALEVVSSVVDAFAGTGFPFYGGDGGPATSAAMRPRGVALAADGRLFIADTENHRIRVIADDGTISTFAGTGVPGFAGDGGDPLDAQLTSPVSVRVVGDDVYVADAGNRRVRRVSGGVISTVAGNGSLDFSGDGGPATAAGLSGGPIDVAFDAGGVMYVAESLRVRRVEPDGTISTYAGTGVYGTSGDGGPATAATLSAATAVALDNAGNLYVGGQGEVRRVTPSGIISTFAGSRDAGASTADGVPATEAALGFVTGLAVSPHGELHISTPTRISKVTADGTMRTVAGTGEQSHTGDVGRATEVDLGIAEHLVVTSRNLLFADSSRARIRRVRLLPSTPPPTLRISNAWIHEPASGNVVMRYRVTREGALTGTSTVSVSALPTGTATAGHDHLSFTTRTLTFPPGDTTRDVDVTVRPDVSPEVPETVLLRLSNASGASIADDTGEGLISDADPGTPATLSVGDVVVGEADGTHRALVTLTRTGDTSQAATVLVQTKVASGTVPRATASADFSAVPPTTVRFAAGDVYRFVEIPIVDDGVDEANEVLWLTLDTPSKLLLTDTRAVVTIVDDDGPVTAGAETFLAIDDLRVVEADAGRAAVSVTVRRRGAVEGTSRVVVSELATSTATTGDHDVFPTQEVEFGPGTTAKTVNVTLRGDAVVETAETVLLRLASAVDAVIEDDQGTVRIVDNEVGTPVSLSIGDPHVVEGDAGTRTLVYTLRRDGSLAETAQVRVATKTVRGELNPAAAGSDYAVVPSTRVDFPIGAATAQVTVSVYADTQPEPDERVTVEVTSPLKVTVADALGTGLVLDDGDCLPC